MAVVSTGSLTLTDLNDSRQLVLYLNANYKTQIYDPNANSYNPNFTSTNLVITPELYIAGGDGSNMLPTSNVKSITWYEGTQTTTAIPETSGTDYSIPTGAVATTAKPLTVKTNFTSKNSQIFTCVIVYTDPATKFDVTAKANIEIVKITNGQKGNTGASAITAILSNDTDNVPSDSNGNNQIVTGVSATVTVYEGATDVTSSWNMGTPVVVGANGTLSGTPTNRIWTLNANGMTADVATVTWTLTRSGYASITKVFTISRVRNGVAGTSPTLYRMITSQSAIKKTEGGVYSPTNIYMEGKSQVGSGAYGTYSGRYKVYTTTSALNASTNWGTAVYTSSADQANYTYPATGTFPAGITGVKIEFYLAGGTTTLLDSQVIPVVQDGNTGQDAYFLNVWCPDGDTIRNGVGSITVHADLYKGGSTITPTAFKWYIQDPTATTASGGDTDGGAGWRLLTSTYNVGITGYTTDTITVPPSAVQGNEGFKCVATSGSKYSNVTMVKDFTDPITTNIVGQDTFKNGEGTVTLKVQLLQNGGVIPNTGYTFRWALYKADGSTLIKTYATTTDTCTIPATDVSGTALLIVDTQK